MNSHVLFDKSIYQQTPLTSFVSVDRYLELVIPPILVREIGGDLAGINKTLKVADAGVMVQKLALRSGVRFFAPHHGMLVITNLLGGPVSMDGRLTANMRHVPSEGGRFGLVVETTPEEELINRWRQGDFLPIEYMWAKRWQRVQSVVRSNAYQRTIENAGISFEQPKTIEGLGILVSEVMRIPAAQPGLLNIVFTDFSVPILEQREVIRRYQSKNPRLLIEEFAPYAALCLKANLLLGLGGNLFKHPHPHDLRDLEYCYYAPFCNVFASDDKLHRKIVPFLLRPNQMFVGTEIVSDLKRLAQEWDGLSKEQKTEFVRTHSSVPPPHEGSVIREIWERYQGPDAVREVFVNEEPDAFFKVFIRKQYGSEAIFDQMSIENASFVIHRSEMLRSRVEELYPWVDVDETKNT